MITIKVNSLALLQSFLSARQITYQHHENPTQLSPQQQLEYKLPKRRHKPVRLVLRQRKSDRS